MKTYEFVFNGDSDKVAERILAGVKTPDCFGERNCLYGKVLKENRFKLYYEPGYNNFCRPVFFVDISEDNGKTLANGRWRLPIMAKIFTLLWIAAEVAIVLLLAGTDWGLMYSSIMALIIFVFYIGIVKFCIWIERNNMKKIITYIESCQNSIDELQKSP